MKKVLVVAPFMKVPGELGYSRFRFLCEIFAREGIDTTIVTSSFSHINKEQRDIRNASHNLPYRINYVYEPGYKRNISIRRIYSHKVFSANLKGYLNKYSESYDAIYCAVPTPETAKVTGDYARRHSIPFIIDVLDLWPEAMRLIIDVPFINKLLFGRLKELAEKVYAMADAVVAVSETYLARVKQVNRYSENNLVVYIGADIDAFDKGIEVNKDRVEKPEGEFWVVYIGTLGHSYDIETLIRAVALLHNKGVKNIRLMVLGTGPLQARFENLARLLNIGAVFTGYLDYGLMAAYLNRSDLAVNAIRRKAPQSIINKIGDYISAGLPVINGSLNEEFRSMVEEHYIGINYDPENAASMAGAIEKLFYDDAARLKMKQNARRLAERRFDRKATYMEIVELVKSIQA